MDGLDRQTQIVTSWAQECSRGFKGDFKPLEVLQIQRGKGGKGGLLLLTKCVDLDIYRARGGAVLTGAGRGALTLGVGGDAAQGARNT